jgi:hypothetical protein
VIKFYRKTGFGVLVERERGNMEDNKEEIKRIEAELKLKQKRLKEELESPFDNVGAANVTAQGLKRGRPKPSVISAVDGEAVNNIAEVAHSQRMQDIERPASNLSSEGTREWAEKEIHNLLPEAVASLKYDIKYGDAKARTDARKEIFAATGIDKREANSFGKGGQIVINLGAGAASGDIQLPFLRRNVEPAAPIIQTLTAKVEPKKDEDK